MRGEETVIQFMHAFGFRRVGMGGNTKAWLNDKGDITALMAEVVIGDGEHHAPVRWSSPVSVGVTLLDEGREPIATYEREFSSMARFRSWYTSIEGSVINRTHPEVDSDELLGAGFTSAD